MGEGVKKDKNGWIDYDAYTPKDGGYLVRYYYLDILTDKKVYETKTATFRDGEFKTIGDYFYDDVIGRGKVTHFQPLPKAPEGEGIG